MPLAKILIVWQRSFRVSLGCEAGTSQNFGSVEESPRQKKDFGTLVRLTAQWIRPTKMTQGRRCIIGVMTDVTQILSQIESGDPNAAEQLLPLVYEELRKLAAAKLVYEKPGAAHALHFLDRSPRQSERQSDMRAA